MSEALNEDLRWLYSLEGMGIKLGLSNVHALLKCLGDPQDSFGAVHVAGSNGKGSVSAMTASVLCSAGYRTGLYTSPHLVRFTERIRVNGREIPDARLSKMIGEVRDIASYGRFPRPPTFFEITTALAFQHFAEAGVEEAVVEVGMGGRLDATNVIRPRCCAITRIGLEHTAFLGDTIGKIAYEKASIIKEGVPTVCSAQTPEAQKVIHWMARCRSSPLRMMGPDFQAECVSRDMQGVTVRLTSLGREARVGLPGRYQCENAAVAAECALELSRQIELSEESILVGLTEVHWPGRLEVSGKAPLTVLDVTHTPEGALAISGELDVFPGSPRVLVLGMLQDKDAKGALASLAAHFDQVICTAPHTPRARSPQELLTVCQGLHPHCQAVDGVAEAVLTARSSAGPEGLVLVCGSLYTVGEAMRFLEGERGP